MHLHGNVFRLIELFKFSPILSVFHKNPEFSLFKFFPDFQSKQGPSRKWVTIVTACSS